MNETYEEYMNRKLLESVQYKPKEEPTKITLYADNEPYQVIDLKDVDEISEEEYNDKFKDAWLRKVSYQVADEEYLLKYYNYEVEEEPEQRKYPLWDHIVYFFDVFLGWALLFITIIGLFVVLAFMGGII